MSELDPNRIDVPLFAREPSPILRLANGVGETVLDHTNTVLYKFTRAPELSHIYWHSEDEQTYIFLCDGINDPTFQALEALEFPICIAWYPTDKDVEMYLQWQKTRLESELAQPTE